MPKKSNLKKGGAFAYVDQFDYPLSPCYHPKNKPPIPKLGWHSGGSSCLNNPSVSQMGIINKPSCLQPNPSEIAWNNRFSCPTKPMNGGNNHNFSVEEIVNNNSKPSNNNKTNNNRKNNNTKPSNNTQPNNNKKNVEMMNLEMIEKLKEKFNMNVNKPTTFFVDAHKNGLHYKIVVYYTPNGNKKFNLTITPNKKNNNNTNIRQEIIHEEIITNNYNTLNGIINKIKHFELKNVSKRTSMNNNTNNKKNVVNNTNNKKNKKPHVPNN